MSGQCLIRKSKFLELKEALVFYNHRFGHDCEIEYFIEVIDYILSGKINFDMSVFAVLYEELLVMSTFYRKSEFLKIVGLFDNLKECVKND